MIDAEFKATFINDTARELQAIANSNPDYYVKKEARGDNAASLSLGVMLEDLKSKGLTAAELAVAKETLLATSTWSSHSEVYFRPITVRGYIEVCKLVAQKAHWFVTNGQMFTTENEEVFA